jgi:small-conductance mechanosensitive channel
MRVSTAALVLTLALGSGHVLLAQQAQAAVTEASGHAVTLTFVNRPIVVLRARVLGRDPAERAETAVRALDALAEERITGPIERQQVDGVVLIRVGGRGVMALAPHDIDELSGDTVDAAADRVIANLTRALAEAGEARAPRVLLRSAVLAAVAFLVGLLAIWALTYIRRAVGRWLEAVAERTAARAGITDLDALRASRLLEIEARLVSTGAGILHLLVIYSTLTFILRRFPYTRPWGESMRGFLVGQVEQLGLSVIDAVPGLFTALLIFLVARTAIRATGLWFDAIQSGRITSRWIYPETAQPTRRLFTLLAWAFAIVVAYPYLPGSETEAFKGVSVFLGLMVTFGSSGLVNQIMSGFMVMYSRALKVGDFVKIGEVEGTVTHLGILSTKVRTLRSEEVTIPNALVVAQTTTDYSRTGGGEGVFTPTSVTIGYDTPWRQIHAMLLMAAARTPGLRSEPKPIVFQAGLEDFYVKYTLFVCLEDQESRLLTLDALHAHIQDVFNEHGVQIMSPNYMLDPATPKIVARADWFAAPARPDGAAPQV